MFYRFFFFNFQYYIWSDFLYFFLSLMKMSENRSVDIEMESIFI